MPGLPAVPPTPPPHAALTQDATAEMRERLERQRQMRKTRITEFKAVTEETRQTVEQQQKRTPSGAFRVPPPGFFAEPSAPPPTRTMAGPPSFADELPCTPGSVDEDEDITSVESAVMKAVGDNEDPLDAGFAALRAQRAQRKARLAEYKKTCSGAARVRQSTSKVLRMTPEERSKLAHEGGVGPAETA